MKLSQKGVCSYRKAFAPVRICSCIGKNLLLYKKGSAPRGAISFLQELTLTGDGSKIDNGRVASLESVLIHTNDSVHVGPN